MNGDRCFVDTNILVYANDIGQEAKQKIARRLIVELVSSGQGCISTQVLAEFWVTVTHKLKPAVSEELARQQIALFDAFHIQTVDHGLFLEALAIQQLHPLSFWDSQIVAAAIRSDCKILYSEDMQAGAEYSGVTIYNPFSL